MTKRPKSPRQYNSTLPQRTTRLTATKPMTRSAACDCTHERSEHTPEGGACLVCACTWYHPNVRSVRRGRKRSKAETQRIYGGEDRIRFVASLPCSVMGCGRTPSENCHATNGGMGRKASAALIFPACRVHHAELHQVGVRTWEAMHKLDVLALAAHTERQWQRHQSAPVPLSRIVPGVVAKLRGEA